MSESTQENIVLGKDITSIWTLSSMYDDGHIIALRDVDGNTYRMSVNEFLKTLKRRKLKAKKMRKYTHLTIA